MADILGALGMTKQAKTRVKNAERVKRLFVVEYEGQLRCRLCVQAGNTAGRRGSFSPDSTAANYTLHLRIYHKEVAAEIYENGMWKKNTELIIFTFFF